MKKISLLALLCLLSAPAGSPRAASAPVGGEEACFAAGTRVATPDGDRPIETLAPGDTVFAYGNGAFTQTRVLRVFRGSARVLSLRAGGRTLLATADHPLLARSGFTRAGELVPDEEIATLSGGKLAWTPVSPAAPSEAPRPVFNLELEAPHTFIAEGIIAHNYYGSRNYSRRRYRELEEQYGTSSPSWGMLSSGDKAGTVMVGVILVVLVISKLWE